MPKTVEQVLELATPQWLKRPSFKRTWAAYKQFTKEQIMKAGLLPVAAIYTNDQCAICQKDSHRCPGWHTPDDKRIAEKVTVKQADGLPGFDRPTTAREQLRLT